MLKPLPNSASNSDSFSVEIAITQADVNVMDWLNNHCDLSKQQLKDAMNKGAAWLQQGKQITRVRRGKKIPEEGNTLFLYYNPTVLEQSTQPAILINETSHYSIWNKPNGMLSHGSKWSDHCSITRWIEQHHQPQRHCFLVHRLDRATSGLIIVAHDKKTTTKLCQLFETRQIDKRYHAIVEGTFPEEETVVESDIDDKPARSIIRRIAYDLVQNRSLLEVKIDTGRKHQVRRHLASIQFPIIGDRLYGKPAIQQEETRIPDLQLRSSILRFQCPVTHENKEFILAGNQQLTLNS